MRLPFELFLALRLLRPRRSYVSVITILSLLGVLAGVGTLIVVLSVMDGFQRELREKIIGFQPHLNIYAAGTMVPDPEVAALLKADPAVEGVSPVIAGPVLAEIHNNITSPRILGVDMDSIDSVLPLKNTIKEGEWMLGPDNIIVGAEWAKQLRASVGDRVYIYAPRNVEQFRAQQAKGEKVDQSQFLPEEYIISGIFSSGYYDYDYNYFLISLPEAQKLYNLGSSFHNLAVRTKDPMQVMKVQQRLNPKLEPMLMEARTWMDQNRHLVGAVAVERVVMFVLLSFIIVVAAIGLMSTLITVTVQKTREIGLLKALGAKDVQVIAIFTLYGFVVGLIGAVLGVAFGLALVEWRNEFRDFLGQQLGMEIFPAEIYNLPLIPAAVNYGTVALIASFGIVFSTIAAFFPAFSASRIDPAQSLHSD